MQFPDYDHYFRLRNQSPHIVRADLDRLSRHITAIELENCDLDDADVIYLCGLPWAGDLKWVALNDNPKITFVGMMALANLPKLTYVELIGNPLNPVMDDDAYVPLAGRELEAMVGRPIPWVRRSLT